MPKVNFTKVEKSLSDALNKLHIENLSEVATIANAIHDLKTEQSEKDLDKIIQKFQKELKLIKKESLAVYKQLNLTDEEEKRLLELSYKEYASNDWKLVKQLKEHLDELKKELLGQKEVSKKDEEQIEKERVRHINKRFNTREGWLPLK